MPTIRKPFSNEYRNELKKIITSLHRWRDNHIIYGDLRYSELSSLNSLLNQISKRLGDDKIHRRNYQRLNK